MTHHVLMVDDETDLLWSMSEQLAQERPDIRFEGSSDPEEALASIRVQAPDLLVTDVRMPKMSGLELIVAARAVAPSLPVVVITAYGSKEVRREVNRLSSVEYLDKPFRFQTLVKAIDQALAREEGFSGSVSVSFPDIIQLYALSMATGALRVSRGQEVATLWFEAGALVHGTVGPLSGEAAVYELLRWKGGSFKLDTGARAPERTIASSWQEILIEGCRLMDELPEDGEDAEDDGHAEPEAPQQDRRVREAWSAAAARAGYPSEGSIVAACPRLGRHVVPIQGGDAAVVSELVLGIVTPLARLAKALDADVVEATAPGVGTGLLRGPHAVADHDFVLITPLTDTNAFSRFRLGLSGLSRALRDSAQERTSS